MVINQFVILECVSNEIIDLCKDIIYKDKLNGIFINANNVLLLEITLFPCHTIMWLDKFIKEGKVIIMLRIIT
jgi:hypothetical protein